MDEQSGREKTYSVNEPTTHLNKGTKTEISPKTYEMTISSLL